MKKGWVFERTPEMGGATGGAFTNPLLGTGMEPAAVLAREAIQNSVDAGRAGEKVRVEFRRVTLSGSRKSDFVNSLGLDPALVSRRKNLKLPRENCLESLGDSKRPLQLLFIEDYGTCGLHGTPNKSKSHFFRLLLSLGDDAKASESEGSGGSYGFGKSVYSSNSRIHTIVAYSVFDQKLSGVPERNHARLMACSYFNQHEHAGEEFSGRAWFGRGRHNDAVVAPLLDDEAHQFAGELGFRRRKMEDHGTSLLVVDCDVEFEILRESIEEWWWPRLLDDEQGLDISLFEQGQRLEPPRPRKRSDLRPFVDCYDLAIGRSIPSGKHQATGQFYKLHDLPLGNYAYAVVGDEVSSDERLREKLGCIALIRKPRMVIEYLTAGGALPLPCVGAFVAAPEVDTFLKRSEPASHDKWDPKSGRLSELPQEAREAVTVVIQRLKAGLRRFAREAAPQAPSQELRLRSLEKLLGGLFRPPTTTPGGGGASPSDPISIRFVEEPHIVAEQGLIATKGSFRVALAEDAGRTRVKVLVSVRCLVQEDEGLSKEDPVPVKLHCDGVEMDQGALNGRVVLELDRESRPAFTFKSEPYDRDWTTHIQVQVEEIQ